MAKTTDHIAKIQKLASIPDVMQLWNAIEAGATPGWPAGKAFEYLVIRSFELEGAEVRYPYEVPGDKANVIEQIDGTIYSLETAFLIESKDFRNSGQILNPSLN
jgi:hypothetical protein